LGDIRSENVFIDFGRAKVKLAIDMSWMGEPHFAAKIVTDWNVFVTPEILQCLVQNRPLSNELLMENDTFEIGMVLAEAILLEDLSKIYETEGTKKVINTQKFEDAVTRILNTRYYSMKLLVIVVGLIRYEAKNRLSSLELCQLLEKS
jgi:hypothetical protein